MVFHTRDAVATRAMRWRPALVLPRARVGFVSFPISLLTETAPKPRRNRTETAPKPRRPETAPKPHRNRTETSPKPHRRAPSSRADRRTCRMSATSAAGVTPEMRDAAAMFSGFASLNFSRSSALRLPTLS